MPAITGLILIYFVMWKRVSNVPAGGVKNDQESEVKMKVKEKNSLKKAANL